MSSNHCPVCESEKLVAGPAYESLATFLFPMPADEAGNVERRKYASSVCTDCSHLFQPTIDNKLLAKIYGEYYQFYPLGTSPDFSPVYREPFDKLFELLTTGGVTQGSKLLEIGCSDPSNLAPYAQQGFDCTGIDPSPLTGESREEGQVRIVSGYYEDYDFDDPFDVIMSKFVLEHAVDLDGHVGKIAMDTAENGMVFIQVPNLMYYVNENQPFFLSHEHVQYFTLRSLATLFSRFDLKLVSALEVSRPSIIGCFTKSAKASGLGAIDNPYPLMRDFFGRMEALEDSARKILSQTDEVIFYGAGLLFWWIVELVDKDKKIRVIDDNEDLHGLVMPSYGYVVEKPNDVLNESDTPVMLTLNPIYHDKVISRIENDFPGREICLLGPDGFSARGGGE